MIITCPECQSQYRLADEVLGAAGKDVRCTTCRHTWLQLPEKPLLPSDEEVVLKTEVEAVPAGVLPGDDPLPTMPVPVETFETILKQTVDQASPEVMKPAASDFKAPSVSYTAIGNVTTAQFGVLVFLLFLFATLLPLFLFKSFIAHHVPPMIALYETIGFDIPAPGQGFRVHDMDAEYQIDKDKKTLIVRAKLTNISEKAKQIPTLEVTLLDPKGHGLKKWVIDKEDSKELASGEAVPVKLEFKDAPEEGVNARIRVAKD